MQRTDSSQDNCEVFVKFQLRHFETSPAGASPDYRPLLDSAACGEITRLIRATVYRPGELMESVPGLIVTHIMERTRQTSLLLK